MERKCLSTTDCIRSCEYVPHI